MGPRTWDSDTTPQIDVPLSMMHLMDLLQLKSWPWGLLFDSFRCIKLGPGADVDESTGSKVLAVGPTLDSLDALYAFDALDSEAPEGPEGEPGSKVLGAL